MKRHKRSEFTLAAKLPPRVLKCALDQERIFNEQLEKSGVDFFDYYLIHNLRATAYRQPREFETFSFVQGK